MRKALVYVSDILAGELLETDVGYSFKYNAKYLAIGNPAVSLTMPLQENSYTSENLFPFFDGLIPEGWLLDVVCHNWKLDERDRFGILLAACADPIGNVSIKEACDEV